MRRRKSQAFSLAEVMIAMVGSMIVLGALLLSSTQLQRALYASERYAEQQTNQRRLIDYLGRDLRRAIGLVTTTNINGGGGVRFSDAAVAVENGVALVVSLPAYYQSQSPSSDTYDEALPVVTAQNYVDYGTEAGPAPATRVLFRKEYVDAERCVCFVRQEEGVQTVIVREAEDLHLQVALSSDGRVCQITVLFIPQGRGVTPRVTTHDQILMRNIRID